jgi:hypothetical protein
LQKISEIPIYYKDKVDKEISSCWDRFSAELQHHIIACIQADLASKYAALPVSVQEKRFGETYISPISAENPSIPVLLPSFNTGAKHHYDLLEILQLQQRAPGRPDLRLDPITRALFGLHEVLPDPEALQQLQQRAATQSVQGPRSKP